MGRSGPLKDCYSHREDASLFGGFGGHEMGWDQIGPRLDWVAQTFVGGHLDYETLASEAGSELAYVVQFEHGECQVIGRTTPLRLDYRVTMVFRWEDGRWKLLHRHADHLFHKERPS